jgi:hypothetical protein
MFRRIGVSISEDYKTGYIDGYCDQPGGEESPASSAMSDEYHEGYKQGWQDAIHGVRNSGIVAN